MAGSARIWIVEDDPRLQTLLRLTLKKQGYDLKFFNDGIEPLTQLSEYGPPDLILLDLMLPELDGLEFLEYLRQQYTSTEVAVIILSARGDIIEGLQLGANDYLTKPFDHNELLARIATHLNIARLTKQNQNTLEKLKELDRLKDQALTVVSHDLKGPVSTFKAGLNMLKENLNVPPGDATFFYGVLDSMEAAVEMMNPLIRELLDWQAIKSQRLQLQGADTNLNSVVQNVVDQYRNLSQRKDVNIILELDDNIPDIYADSLRLKQIISNLLNNAIKYSPDDSDIIVRTKHNGSTIQVEVADNGPGIAPEDVSRLFREFTPLNNNGNGIHGTGVGLYIAHRLVEMHNGHLQVDTQLGEGSTFWFELPVNQDQEENVQNLLKIAV